MKATLYYLAGTAAFLVTVEGVCRLLECLIGSMS